MPAVSVWMLRAALGSLALGFTLGGLMLWDKGLPLSGEWAVMRPLHIELLLIGWVVQLTMGVAIWILPRFGMRRTAGTRDAVGWLALVLLNGGVWLSGTGILVGVGRLAELGAAAAFVIHVWGRVLPSGLSEM